jgi:hypothetical protein
MTPYLLIPTDEIPLSNSSGANPCFDGTLSIDVAGTEWNASAVGLVWSSTMPGGYASCSFTIPDVYPYAPALTGIATDAVVTITHGAGPETVWVGVICNDPSIGYAGETAYVTVECEGYLSVARRRQDFCREWSTQSYETFVEHRASNQNYSMTSDGMIEVRAEQETHYKNQSWAGYLVCMNNMLGPLGPSTFEYWGDIAFDYAGNLGSANAWEFCVYCGAYADTLATIEATTLICRITGDGGALSGSIARPCFDSYLYFILKNDSGGTLDPAANRYIQVTNLTMRTAWYTPMNITNISTANPTECTTTSAHGMVNGDYVIIADTASTPNIAGRRQITKTANTTFTVAVNVSSGTATDATAIQEKTYSVDNVMANIGTATGLAVTTDTDTLDTLTHAVIRPYMTYADALSEIAALNSVAFDWGFWGTEFFATERPAVVAIPAGHRYIIDGATTPGIEVDLHEQPDGYADYVRVVYADRAGGTYPDGTILQTVRPSDPGWTDASKRVAILDLSGTTMDAAAAAAAGDQYLEWAAANREQGTVTVRVPYLPLAEGGEKLAIYAKAGDWLGVSQIAAHEAAPLLITGVDVDADSGTVTLSIGENKNEFVASMLSGLSLVGGPPKIIQGTPFGPGKGFPG